MKETGVVRKLDELGRVVIPKEIRKTLRINEGDMVEIYVDGSDVVALKKHSPFKINEDDSYKLSKTLYDKFKNTILITDEIQIIGGYGPLFGEHIDQYLSKEYKKIFKEQSRYYGPSNGIKENSKIGYTVLIRKLFNKEEEFGTICMIEENTKIDSNCEQIFDFVASYFAKKLEA